MILFSIKNLMILFSIGFDNYTIRQWCYENTTYSKSSLRQQP